MFQNKVYNKELIGRLTSMLYSFVDGHIYYNNNVIKIRYDLLESKTNQRNYGEAEIFNYFDNLL